MKVVFITGSATGFGLAIAKRCARAGWRVCLSDVHPHGDHLVEELNLLGGEAVYFPCDVTDEAAFVRIAEQLESLWGGVDVVVNNAGIAQSGKIAEVPLSDWQRVIDINLLGVVRGCKAFIPGFQERGRGHFINISSLAGILDSPYSCAYNAAKAGVVMFSETLDLELRGAGIEVSVVCPDFAKTDFSQSLVTPDPKFRGKLEKRLSDSTLTADDMAEAVFEVIQNPRFWVLPQGRKAWIWMLKRLLPRRWYLGILRRLYR